jgi:hypothetical protein
VKTSRGSLWSILFLLPLLHGASSPPGATSIDREKLVCRHLPLLSAADPLSSFSVGNGSFTYTADIPALQTFPDFYEQGIPLATQSERGWHTIPDPNRCTLADAVEYWETDGRRVPYVSRQNSIYVTGDIYRGNSRIWQGELKTGGALEIHAFPGPADSTGSFTYVDYTDDYKGKTMSLSHGGRSNIFNSAPLSVNSIVGVKCDSAPKSVLLNDRPAVFEYNSENGLIRVAAEAGKDIHLNFLY